MTNVATLEIIIANDEDKRGISPPKNGILTDDTKNDVEEVLSEIVRKQIKIIVYLGSDIVGAELAKVGHYKELSGGSYAWVGSM